MDELIPNWKDLDSPIKTDVRSEDFLFYTNNKSIKIPNFLLPKALQNHGNYIISLSNLCKWLGEFAENLGVEIFPGFAASKLIYDESNQVIGVQTGDMGLDKENNPKDNFEPGINIKGKVTVLSEGCRGHLVKEALNKGSYVGIATHDEFLIDNIYSWILENKISKNRFEFQVLHGVPMKKMLKKLMDEGNTVRVYLPYGDNWYDYSVRRLKENPKMAGYIIKNLFFSIFRIK